MKRNKKKHKHRKTTGVQGIGSGQPAENNSSNSFKKQTESKNKSDTGNSARKGEKMKYTILICKDTDLDQVGNDLIAESNKDNPRLTQLMINNASTFKIQEMEKLGAIMAHIPLVVNIHILKEIDIRELAFTLICHNNDIIIPNGIKINMDSLEPMTDQELSIIVENIANLTKKDAKEIMKYYMNKDKIEIEFFLQEQDR